MQKQQKIRKVSPVKAKADKKVAKKITKTKAANNLGSKTSSAKLSKIPKRSQRRIGDKAVKQAKGSARRKIKVKIKKRTDGDMGKSIGKKVMLVQLPEKEPKKPAKSPMKKGEVVKKGKPQEKRRVLVKRKKKGNSKRGTHASLIEARQPDRQPDTSGEEDVPPEDAPRIPSGFFQQIGAYTTIKPRVFFPIPTQPSTKGPPRRLKLPREMPDVAMDWRNRSVLGQSKALCENYPSCRAVAATVEKGFCCPTLDGNWLNCCADGEEKPEKNLA